MHHRFILYQTYARNRSVGGGCWIANQKRLDLNFALNLSAQRYINCIMMNCLLKDSKFRTSATDAQKLFTDAFYTCDQNCSKQLYENFKNKTGQSIIASTKIGCKKLHLNSLLSQILFIRPLSYKQSRDWLSNYIDFLNLLSTAVQVVDLRRSPTMQIVDICLCYAQLQYIFRKSVKIFKPVLLAHAVFFTYILHVCIF